jgi:hypothetical protein
LLPKRASSKRGQSLLPLGFLELGQQLADSVAVLLEERHGVLPAARGFVFGLGIVSSQFEMHSVTADQARDIPRVSSQDAMAARPLLFKRQAG